MKHFLFIPSIVFLSVFFSCSKSSGPRTSGNSNGNPAGGSSDTIGHNIILWGTTSYGGPSDSGTVFKIRGDGSDFQVIHSFNHEEGITPQGPLCKAPNGKLYGLTSGGGSGAQQAGTIFSIDPATGSFKKIFDQAIIINGTTIESWICNEFTWFTCAADGKLYCPALTGVLSVDPATDAVTLIPTSPQLAIGLLQGSFVAGSDGKLYAYGRISSPLTFQLVSFDPAKQRFQVIQGKMPLSATPIGGACFGADGAFYSLARISSTTAAEDGSTALYKMTLDGQYTNLETTDASNKMKVWNPFGLNNMVLAEDEAVYGVTYMGGIHQQGAIVKITPGGAVAPSIVASLDSTIGELPNGGLMRASNNLLYLMGQGGKNTSSFSFGMTLMRFDPSSSQLTTVHEVSQNDIITHVAGHTPNTLVEQ